MTARATKMPRRVSRVFFICVFLSLAYFTLLYLLDFISLLNCTGRSMLLSNDCTGRAALLFADGTGCRAVACPRLGALKGGVEKILHQGFGIAFHFVRRGDGEDLAFVNDRDAVGDAESQVAVV